MFLWLVGPRIHDVLFLSRLFLDMLDLRHVLDTHYLVVFPLPSSISTSGESRLYQVVLNHVSQDPRVVVFEVVESLV